MKKIITWKLKLALLAILPAVLFGLSFWLHNIHAVQASGIISQLTPEVAISKTDIDQIIAGKPSNISLPSQGIDLAVADGEYNQKTGEWTLTKDKAHFAVISRNPNNYSGNTFIYGHNTDKVFKRLQSVKTDDIAQINTENGYRFTYKYRRSVEVSPRDTSIFSYEGPAILTLQTCSGLWDQSRQLLTFDLEKVEKL